MDIAICLKHRGALGFCIPCLIADTDDDMNMAYATNTREDGYLQNISN